MTGTGLVRREFLSRRTQFGYAWETANSSSRGASSVSSPEISADFYDFQKLP